MYIVVFRVLVWREPGMNGEVKEKGGKGGSTAGGLAEIIQASEVGVYAVCMCERGLVWGMGV